MTSLPRVAANPLWLGSRCVLCERDYPPAYDGFTCTACGSAGILDPHYDYAAGAAILRKGSDPIVFADAPGGGMWRFGTVLPVEPLGPAGAWTLGDSPLHEADRLAAHLGLASLMLKDDTGLPSGSLKDRAAAVALAHARLIGAGHLACASTGNAAASLAVLAARAGLPATIFVPAAAPLPKVAQLLLHGAEVITVDGTYDQAYDLSLAALKKHRWYSRNCAHNALLAEGKKTAALELARTVTAGFRSGQDNLPDAVLVPVGDGCIVSATAKAFAELQALGLTTRSPRIIGVQATGAAPLARAWAHHTDPSSLTRGPDIMAAIPTGPVSTVADSICVGVPRNRVKAWIRVAASGGGFVQVSDEAILEAIGLLARLAGIFAEPSAAAALAGVVAARGAGLLDSGDRVAVLVTGHGLKDPQAGMSGVRIPPPVPPLPVTS